MSTDSPHYLPQGSFRRPPPSVTWDTLPLSRMSHHQLYFSLTLSPPYLFYYLPPTLVWLFLYLQCVKQCIVDNWTFAKRLCMVYMLPSGKVLQGIFPKILLVFTYSLRAFDWSTWIDNWYQDGSACSLKRYQVLFLQYFTCGKKNISESEFHKALSSFQKSMVILTVSVSLSTSSSSPSLFFLLPPSFSIVFVPASRWYTQITQWRCAQQSGSQSMGEEAA